MQRLIDLAWLVRDLAVVVATGALATIVIALCFGACVLACFAASALGAFLESLP